jgi:hypothetical protein
VASHYKKIMARHDRQGLDPRIRWRVIPKVDRDMNLNADQRLVLFVGTMLAVAIVVAAFVLRGSL